MTPAVPAGACPPTLSASQLPVCLFPEFLLTPGQQNTEIRAINGGNGNDSEFLEEPTSDRRQKSLILESSRGMATPPDGTSQRAGMSVPKAEMYLGPLMLPRISTNSCSKCLEQLD